MTPKEHVLKIHPEAYATQRYFSDYEYCWEIRTRLVEFIGDGYTARKAWENAWKSLQNKMIKKLENTDYDF